MQSKPAMALNPGRDPTAWEEAQDTLTWPDSERLPLRPHGASAPCPPLRTPFILKAPSHHPVLRQPCWWGALVPPRLTARMSLPVPPTAGSSQPSESPEQARPLCLGLPCTDGHQGPQTGSPATVCQPGSQGPLTPAPGVGGTLRSQMQDPAQNTPSRVAAAGRTSCTVDPAPVKVASGLGLAGRSVPLRARGLFQPLRCPPPSQRLPSPTPAPRPPGTSPPLQMESSAVQ